MTRSGALLFEMDASIETLRRGNADAGAVLQPDRRLPQPAARLERGVNDTMTTTRRQYPAMHVAGRVPLRNSWTLRSGVLVGVVALHAIALLVAVRVRMSPDPQVPAVALMHVDLLALDAPSPASPVREPLPLPPVETPTLAMPVVDLPAWQDVAPPVESVPVAPAPAVVSSPVPAQSSAPVLVGADQVDYLRRPAPRYPHSARRARLQGTVLLWVLIDPEGRPQEVRVERSSGYEQLDREGRDAVLHALFKPYRVRGIARSAQAIVPIEFTLGSSPASRS